MRAVKSIRDNLFFISLSSASVLVIFVTTQSTNLYAASLTDTLMRPVNTTTTALTQAVSPVVTPVTTTVAPTVQPVVDTVTGTTTQSTPDTQTTSSQTTDTTSQPATTTTTPSSDTGPSNATTPTAAQSAGDQSVGDPTNITYNTGQISPAMATMLYKIAAIASITGFLIYAATVIPRNRQTGLKLYGTRNRILNMKSGN